MKDINDLIGLLRRLSLKVSHEVVTYEGYQRYDFILPDYILEKVVTVFTYYKEDKEPEVLYYGNLYTLEGSQFNTKSLYRSLVKYDNKDLLDILNLYDTLDYKVMRVNSFMRVLLNDEGIDYLDLYLKKTDNDIVGSYKGYTFTEYKQIHKMFNLPIP